MTALTPSLGSIAILGGTGKEGQGLAARLAVRGHEVVIGSRARQRAEAVAADVSRLSGHVLRGMENASAAAAASIAVLTIPFDGMSEILHACAEALQGKLVVSAVVPMTVGAAGIEVMDVPEGSAAGRAAALLPASRITAAFHSVSASHLRKLDQALDEDTPFAAAPTERELMEALCAEVGLRGVWAGGLDVAGRLESLTPLIVGINRIHKSNAGIRFTGLP
jgi:NADPH-dependent F420 reductase